MRYTGRYDNNIAGSHLAPHAAAGGVRAALAEDELRTALENAWM